MSTFIDRLARRRIPVAPERRPRYPLRAVVYALLNRLSPDLRFEFELFHLDDGDPWDVRTSAYAAEQYSRVLERIKVDRPRAGRVLEIGCSIGIFTRLLATEFAEVVAVDVSREALRLARREVGEARNVEFVRADVRGLRLERSFDVIVAAEVLYLMPKRAVDPVCSRLRQLLAPDGVLIYVAPFPPGRSNGLSYQGWAEALELNGFQRTGREVVESRPRPYSIDTFSSRRSKSGS